MCERAVLVISGPLGWDRMLRCAPCRIGKLLMARRIRRRGAAHRPPYHPAGDEEEECGCNPADVVREEVLYALTNRVNLEELVIHRPIE